MNELTIKMKTEQALAAYLASSLATFPSPVVRTVPVTCGHAEQVKNLPAIIVYGEKSRECPGMEKTGVFEVNVRIFILTHAGDEHLANQQLRAEAVQSTVGDVAAVMRAVNIPVGKDVRKIRDFHLYDLVEWDDDEGRTEKHHGDVLAFKAKVQGRNGLG